MVLMVLGSGLWSTGLLVFRDEGIGCRVRGSEFRV